MHSLCNSDIVVPYCSNPQTSLCKLLDSHIIYIYINIIETFASVIDSCGHLECRFSFNLRPKEFKRPKGGAPSKCNRYVNYFHDFLQRFLKGSVTWYIRSREIGVVHAPVDGSDRSCEVCKGVETRKWSSMPVVHREWGSRRDRCLPPYDCSGMALRRLVRFSSRKVILLHFYSWPFSSICVHSCPLTYTDFIFIHVHSIRSTYIQCLDRKSVV